MGTLDKLIDKVMSGPVPRDITYQELERILLSVGFKKREGGKGSHLVYYHYGLPSILTIPVHGNHVKAIYVKMAREALQDLGV